MRILFANLHHINIMFVRRGNGMSSGNLFYWSSGSHRNTCSGTYFLHSWTHTFRANEGDLTSILQKRLRMQLNLRKLLFTISIFAIDLSFAYLAVTSLNRDEIMVFVAINKCMPIYLFIIIYQWLKSLIQLDLQSLAQHAEKLPC